MKLNTLFKTTAIVGGTLLTANAMAVDVSTVTATFSELSGHYNSIGGQMVGAVGAGIIFKWILGFII